MNEPLVIPKYIIRELERASKYAQKSRQCASIFEKWLDRAIRDNYSAPERLDFFKNLDEFTIIKHGGTVDIDALESAVNIRIDCKITTAL
jgi:hypothetical protein